MSKFCFDKCLFRVKAETKLNQHEIALAIGVNEASLTRWKKNNDVMPMKILHALGELCGVNYVTVAAWGESK